MRKLILTALLSLLILSPLDAHASTKGLAAPQIKQGSKVVTLNKVSVSVKKKKGYKYYYTTNGKAPTKKSKQYKDPVSFKKSGTFKVIGVKDGQTTPVATCKVKFTNVAYSTSLDSNKNYSGKQTLYVGTEVTNEEIYYKPQDGEAKKIGKKTKIALNDSMVISFYYKKNGELKSIDEKIYLIDTLGIKGKYGSGKYKKPITISFSTKKSNDNLRYLISGTGIDGTKVCYDNETYNLTKGKYSVMVIAGKGSTAARKVYNYVIK